MRVEVLYFEGCPGHEALLPRLRRALLELGLENQEVELRRVESVEAAERERFLGSPTLRVDGVDVEPTAADRTDFGLKCRLYATDAGLRGLPSDQLIETALRRATRPSRVGS